MEEFELTPETIANAQQRIRWAFERGDTEIMIGSFPSEFCTDHGRAINNADLPPLVAPTKEEEERMRDAPPAWLGTVPTGLRKVYDYWKTHMKPGGFKFSMRIIDYRDGRPGNVGTFISWSTSPTESEG